MLQGLDALVSDGGVNFLKGFAVQVERQQQQKNNVELRAPPLYSAPTATAVVSIGHARRCRAMLQQSEEEKKKDAR